MTIKLTDQEIKQLYEALHYCKMEELRSICQNFRVSQKGQKKELITRIMHFAGHGAGSVMETKKIPLESCKKSGIEYPLEGHTLILYGDFKNNLITRQFLKRLIGNHFHFTAFGQDWIKARWYAGNPPTYKEFAQFWQAEYMRRKGNPQALKPEWAYLNFVRNFKKEHPQVTRDELLVAWERMRQQHKSNTLRLLLKLK